MLTPKRKRNLLDFRQKREIVEIQNPSIYWQMMSSSDLDFLNINEEISESRNVMGYNPREHVVNYLIVNACVNTTEMFICE